MIKQQRKNDKRVGFPDISDSQAVLLWGKPGEKPLGARTRTNNKLSPPMTPGPGIETEPGGERSHHCAIPAPLMIYLILLCRGLK